MQSFPTQSDGLVGRKFQILDHGYLMYIEHWGSDTRIVESARMSTGKGFLGWEPATCPDCNGRKTIARIAEKKHPNTKRIWNEIGRFIFDPPLYTETTIVDCPSCNGKGTIPGDIKLLKYLRENKHTTPFEMGGLVIEVLAPIMVFREWHRHRTQSYNEMSARYTPLPDTNYIPDVPRCLMVQGRNRQAGTLAGSDELTHTSVLEWLEELASCYDRCEEVYQSGLKRGIPKELARLSVPVGRYSKMRASANLKNWLDFLTLRMDYHAQWEIRQFANCVGEIIRQVFPKTYGLFWEGFTKSQEGKS